MGKIKYLTKEEKLLAKKLNQKKYYEKNKEKEKNKEIEKEKRKNYRIKNKDSRKNYQQEYRKKNKESIREKRIQYTKNRYNTDILFKLSTIIRNSIKQSLKIKKYIKNGQTNEIIGCSYQKLKEYLESLFEPWMNWNNYGLYNGELNYGWDIDHIIPLSSAKSESELLMLNHFSNLQPLCSHINRYVKRNNII